MLPSARAEQPPSDDEDSRQQAAESKKLYRSAKLSSFCHLCSTVKWSCVPRIIFIFFTLFFCLALFADSSSTLCPRSIQIDNLKFHDCYANFNRKFSLSKFSLWWSVVALALAVQFTSVRGGVIISIGSRRMFDWDTKKKQTSDVQNVIPDLRWNYKKHTTEILIHWLELTS